MPISCAKFCFELDHRIHCAYFSKKVEASFLSIRIRDKVLFLLRANKPLCVVKHFKIFLPFLHNFLQVNVIEETYV